MSISFVCEHAGDADSIADLIKLKSLLGVRLTTSLCSLRVCVEDDVKVREDSLDSIEGTWNVSWAGHFKSVWECGGCKYVLRDLCKKGHVGTLTVCCDGVEKKYSVDTTELNAYVADDAVILEIGVEGPEVEVESRFYVVFTLKELLDYVGMYPEEEATNEE